MEEFFLTGSGTSSTVEVLRARLNLMRQFWVLVGEGKEGFVIDLQGKEYTAKYGYGVRVQSYGNNFIEALDHVQPGQYIGWFKDENGNSHIDIIEIYDESLQACVVALTRRETSMFDFKNDKLIDFSTLYDDGYEND